MRLVFIPRAALLAAVCALGGCGASSQPGPSSSPSGPPTTEGSVSVPAHGFLSVPLNTTRSGTLTVRLSLSRNVVVAGIFTPPCTAGTRSGCTSLVYTPTASDDSSMTLTAPGAAAGSYVMILGNVGAASQSVSYSLTTS